MSGELTPLDRYQVAVEALVSSPSKACVLRADESHFDTLAFVWTAPWYAKWWRMRRFSKLQRQHERLGNTHHRARVRFDNAHREAARGWNYIKSRYSS